MSHRGNREKNRADRVHEDRDGAEALLRAEVAFWREMIGACDADHPPASLERMQQALALAEYRLIRCFRAHAGQAAAIDGPGRTSGSADGSLH